MTPNWGLYLKVHAQDSPPFVTSLEVNVMEATTKHPKGSEGHREASIHRQHECKTGVGQMACGFAQLRYIKRL